MVSVFKIQWPGQKGKTVNTLWHSGQVERRWSRQLNIMGSIPIHAFIVNMVIMPDGCYRFLTV